ncbi:ceramide synthase 5-like [Mizuhopecten yessoensis]|uniref:Ceramide synthase 5 n=1 Tax=Mizuhopecten yessoensis TaxID=6573 RepID=A0A210R5U6_MIZYE|nr:ceramide synthase 5-like [Mizuhopecten yessoensis]OWF56268.1 Ceramide synthase 5 [Mizuhopecten yessoensis]
MIYMSASCDETLKVNRLRLLGTSEMAMLQEVSSWFWKADHWLHNTTWDEIENPPPGVYYPLGRDILLPSIAIAVILLGIRLVYDWILVVPFALCVGLNFKKQYTIEKNPTLEAAYAVDKYNDQTYAEELGKKTSLTGRQIQRWFRHRRSREMPGRMKKFRECSWYFLFYTISFLSGLYILWDKPFFWDTKYCWIGCSKHHVPNDLYWYYTIEMGFYWHMLLMLMFDSKRKDFPELVVHHIVTVLLLYFSFVSNQLRIGSLVLILHDSNDFMMAPSKMANYAKKQVLAEYFFVVFFVVWLVSKLIIYPFWLVWSATFESLQYIDRNSLTIAYWSLNSLLWVLQILHIIWTILLSRIILSKFSTDQKMKDVSEDTEDSSDEEEDDISKETDVITNGSTNGLTRRPQTNGTRG